MDTTRFTRRIAALALVATAFAVTGCDKVAAPAQQINPDRSDTQGDISTGNNKLPPDSRP
jgi:hypothetical protein